MNSPCMVIVIQPNEKFHLIYIFAATNIYVFFVNKASNSQTYHYCTSQCIWCFDTYILATVQWGMKSFSCNNLFSYFQSCYPWNTDKQHTGIGLAWHALGPTRGEVSTARLVTNPYAPT